MVDISEAYGSWGQKAVLLVRHTVHCLSTCSTKRLHKGLYMVAPQGQSPLRYLHVFKLVESGNFELL